MVDEVLVRQVIAQVAHCRQEEGARAEQQRCSGAVAAATRAAAQRQSWQRPGWERRPPSRSWHPPAPGRRAPRASCFQAPSPLTEDSVRGRRAVTIASHVRHGCQLRGSPELWELPRRALECSRAPRASGPLAGPLPDRPPACSERRYSRAMCSKQVLMSCRAHMQPSRLASNAAAFTGAPHSRTRPHSLIPLPSA